MTRDLYQIILTDSTAEQLVSEIRINALHPIFSGHFPGSPVTPGVIQMEMVQAAMEKHFQKKLTLKTIRSCKFLEVLDPGKTPAIRITIKFRQTEFLEVTATGADDASTFFKLQATYI